MEREQFIFKRSFYDSIKRLPDKVQLKVLKMVLAYGLDDEIIKEDNIIADSIFQSIKPQIEYLNKYYDEKKRQGEFGKMGAEYGKLGGRPKKKSTLKENPLQQENTPPYSQQENPLSSKEETPEKPPKNPLNNNINNNINIKKEKLSNESKKKSEEIVVTTEVVTTLPKRTPQELLKEREIKFYNDLVEFVGIYGKETIRAFYNYWSEPNPSKTKMRFELEKVFDIKRRLTTWSNREKRYNNGTTTNSRSSETETERRNREARESLFEDFG